MATFPAHFLSAQILMSGGGYSQNFDSLASSGTPSWTDNSTLPGWYISTNAQSAAFYRTGAGTASTGGIYSFGTNGVNSLSDRALGSIAASSVIYAYGVRFTNDTTFAQTDITISFAGEQWRAANTVTNTLAFSYQISGFPLTNADAVNSQNWNVFSNLNFDSPDISGGSALDGNAPANHRLFSDIVLTGAVVQPGQELFLRWRDVDDSGSDAGIAIDDLNVNFQATSSSLTAPVITSQPQSVATGEGGFAIFSVTATGVPTPAFQWRWNGTNLPDATGPVFALSEVNSNQAGIYSCAITNSVGGTNSFSGALIVVPTSIDATDGEIRFLQYNVAGNNTDTGTDPASWSTNATQVKAIGRELMHFNPDIITFNEIPTTNGVAQMPDWMNAFLPGYHLATNSFGDTFIQSVIASRFPITRSASHLHSSNLDQYGYTASNFSRDLFEAQIAVPNWPLPLHVFVAHLKATTGSAQDSADKRAAEASAVSNYFASVYLTGTNAAHPYILAGDLNEDAYFPETADYTSGHPLQRITAPATGLQMTIPINPITHTDWTESIRGTLDTRFDYILPCAMLFSNVAAMEVFRTDLLTNIPPDLYSNDDKSASDHLPVLMVFKNPFDTPFRLLSIARTNQRVTLEWESQNNRNYRVEASTDLMAWTPFATNLLTTNEDSPFIFETNGVSDSVKFFRIYRAP